MLIVLNLLLYALILAGGNGAFDGLRYGGHMEIDTKSWDGGTIFVLCFFVAGLVGGLFLGILGRKLVPGFTRGMMGGWIVFFGVVYGGASLLGAAIGLESKGSIRVEVVMTPLILIPVAAVLVTTVIQIVTGRRRVARA